MSHGRFCGRESLTDRLHAHSSLAHLQIVPCLSCARHVTRLQVHAICSTKSCGVEHGNSCGHAHAHSGVAHGNSCGAHVHNEALQTNPLNRGSLIGVCPAVDTVQSGRTLRSICGGRQKECKLRRGRVAFLRVSRKCRILLTPSVCGVTVVALERKPSHQGLASFPSVHWDGQ